MMCFDIRSFFKESPQLVACPFCQDTLSHQDIQPSSYGRRFIASATIPLVDTILYYCNSCGWWAIRELCVDCELEDGCCDYLVIPANKQDSGRLAHNKDDPQITWEQATEDSNQWSDLSPLDQGLASFIFGPKEVAQKRR